MNFLMLYTYYLSCKEEKDGVASFQYIRTSLSRYPSSKKYGKKKKSLARLNCEESNPGTAKGSCKTPPGVGEGGEGGGEGGGGGGAKQSLILFPLK
jgi:uncharacterized membrane protein